MQVILLKDVAKVGQHGTIQDVADGYAINYLIPRNLAEMATPEKLFELKSRAAAVATSTKKREQKWALDAERINGNRVTVALRANAEGNLYQRLSSEIIEHHIRTSLGVEVPTGSIVLNTPIKSVGETTIGIRFGKHEAFITVNVIQSREDETRF